jgi:hypothetical protein
MNKIPVRKSSTTPRHHIIYNYRTKQAQKIEPIISKKPKTIDVVKPKPKAIIKRSTKSNVKIVSAKTNFIPKVASRNTKSTFDSRLPKIKSIKGVGEGKILVMFAPGPSILQAEIEKLKGICKIDTMTINKPDKRLWPTDYWMFCDRTQYNRNKEEYHKYNKIIINTDSIKAQHKNQIKINNLSGKGFSIDMIKGFYIGRSTTFSAMQVAAWMGYEKIFIFGLDMCRVGKKLHSYGSNPDVPENIREKRFKKEAEFYDAAAKIMSEELRSKYYICSDYNKWPFVNMFNKISQKDAIEFILDCAGSI